MTIRHKSLHLNLKQEPNQSIHLSINPGALLTQVQSVQCTAGPCSDGPLFLGK